MLERTSLGKRFPVSNCTITRNRPFMIRQRRFRRRVLDRRVKVHKSVSHAFKCAVIQPDIIIYSERIWTEDLGSFRAWAIENRGRPNRSFGPIIPLRSDSRHVFLDVGALRSVDLTPVWEDARGSAKAKQDAGNADQRDRQQPELILQKVANAQAGEKADDH